MKQNVAVMILMVFSAVSGLAGVLHRQVHTEEKTNVRNGVREVLRYPDNTADDADEPQGSCRVRCSFIFDPQEFSDGTVTVLNGDFYHEYDHETESVEVMLDPGIYDFIEVFTRIEDDGPNWSYVVKENVEVKGDMELTFDVGSADQCVVFRTILPDGSEARLPVLTYIDEEPYAVWDTSESNVDYIGYSGSLINLEYGRQAAGYFGNARYIRGDNGFDGQISFDILINRLSDRYSFLQTQSLVGENMFVNSIKECAPVVGGLLRNDPQDFRKLEYELVNTPLADIETRESYNSQVFAGYLGNVGLIKSTYSYMQSENPDVYIENPRLSVSEEYAPVTHVYVKRMDVYRCEKGESIWDDKWIRYGVQTPLARLEGGRFRFVNFGSAESAYSIIADKDGHYDFSGFAPFSFWMGEQEAVFGDNAPVLSFSSQAYEFIPGMRMLQPTIKYLGRYGEERGSDIYCMRGGLHVDGEPLLLDASWSDIRSAIVSRGLDGLEPGFITLKLDDRNVCVDGISGFNMAEIGFDEAGDDACPPSLQGLQMHDASGRITDRFTSPADGVLEFIGADFNWLIDENRFDCDPVDEVVFEYAPRGSQEFYELMADNIPELFQTPGFGYLWRVQLEGVSHRSVDGWYDVRISLRDKAGNYMTQTVSPAFRIESMSGNGVSQTMDDSLFSDGMVEVWTLDGSLVTVIASRAELCGLPPAFYLLRGSGRTVKYISR